MKIGLILGSFDPIHIAHINLASCVLNANLCDKVLFVVAKQNPWKNNEPTPFNLRCEMISASLRPFQDKCDVCALEEEIEPPTYSYKVLDLIREKHPNDELYLIVGSDTLEGLHLWRKYEEKIKPFFKVISVERDSLLTKTNDDKPFLINDNDDNLKGIAPLTMIISSTIIRNMISQGMNPYPYVTQETLEIINKFNLYKNR